MVRVIAGEFVSDLLNTRFVGSFLTAAQDITLADDFGYAPATLVYKGMEAPLGKTNSKL